MGKYTRKSKNSGEVAIMDVAHSSFGVWTRAKKLALQNSSSSSSVTAAAATTTTATTKTTTTTPVGSSYLQLRSRRLEKPLILAADSKRRKNILKDACASNPSSSREPNKLSTNSRSTRSTLPDSLKEIQSDTKESKANEDVGFQVSFGEKGPESDDRCDRSIRESTPCSLIKNTENIKRTTCPTNVRFQEKHTQKWETIPTANEMEELFAGPEQHQQNKFIQKYNFDPVNDKPLPGRYEWEKLDL